MRRSNVLKNLREVAYHIADAGLIEVENSENLESIIVSPRGDYSWGHVAQLGSMLTKGTWIATRTGCFWNLKDCYGWLQGAEHHKQAERAREIAVKLTGEAKGWGVGSNARHCLQWAVAPCKERPKKEAVQKRNGIGHFHCNPGKYPNQRLYDLDAAYWRIGHRLKSLHWIEDRPGYFSPVKHSKEEQYRLGKFFAYLDAHKLMRNSVWGSMLGGGGSSSSWCGGATIKSGAMPGHCVTAALIVGRIAWELTSQVAFESQSPYTKTDCVVMDAHKKPDLWDALGFPYGIRAEGDADIKARDMYAVGKKWVGAYHPLEKHEEHHELAPQLQRLYRLEYLN